MKSSHVLSSNAMITGDPKNMVYGQGSGRLEYHEPYIGDFPDFVDPWQPNIFPQPQKKFNVYPVGPAYPWIDPAPFYPMPTTITVTSSTSSLNEWRVLLGTDKATASVDLPGVKLEDLAVEIENGTIKVTAKRFDNRHHVSKQQFIGPDFDPKTAEATLEAGVLTVVVSRFKEKATHKVPVKAQ